MKKKNQKNHSFLIIKHYLFVPVAYSAHHPCRLLRSTVLLQYYINRYRSEDIFRLFRSFEKIANIFLWQPSPHAAFGEITNNSRAGRANKPHKHFEESQASSGYVLVQL